jgi:hypothetical protein
MLATSTSREPFNQRLEDLHEFTSCPFVVRIAQAQQRARRGTWLREDGTVRTD